MTRGKIVAVLPDGRLVTSTEFNGDMYYSDGGYGQEIVEALESIEKLFMAYCQIDIEDFVQSADIEMKMNKVGKK